MTTRPYSLRADGTTVAMRYKCGCEFEAIVEANETNMSVLRRIADTRGKLCPKHEGGQQ